MKQGARLAREVALGVCVLVALLTGGLLGLSFAANDNIQSPDIYNQSQPALPTQILDRNGRLITEFFRDEKREIIRINDMPPHLIQALLTREDRHFFDHRGFRIPDLLRATWNLVTGKFRSGASTITQQLAGSIYADRTEISIRRKLIELWWALQLEKWLTKNEILERYLNLVYFGEGTYGVEAASQFYFKHSAKEVSVAEAAMLVIQLNRPGGNSPINYPNRAKKLQREILYQMTELGYITEAEATISFEKYWKNYDFTRSNRSSAFLEREDAAPYFSEYVRQQLDELLLGSMDVYKDGLVVHTTLDLAYQEIAQKTIEKHLRRVNSTRNDSSTVRLDIADETFLPMIDLLSLTFNINDIRAAGIREQNAGIEKFTDDFAPALDAIGMMLNSEDLRYLARLAYQQETEDSKKTQIEGALVTIDSNTGHILAMVGGSKFETGNQFNRAIQAKIQPGSSFKPLYYSAAISSGKFTPASMILDKPVIFLNDDGTQYIPLNYKGEWKGRVLLRTALAKSMNVPSLRILDEIGFDVAIERASKMLGITSPEQIEATFPRKYPLGLGIIAVSPIQMARAYATFANAGKAVTPLGIQFVEDRNGRMILEVEKNLRSQERMSRANLQLMKPQVAYIMTNLLQSTIKWGTLRWASSLVGGFNTETAGKTGTTQNWSDAWTVGFTPKVTTALWMGFDERGESLGLNLTGATATGPAWTEYMKAIEPNQPLKFTKPETGLVETTVNAQSGLLPSGTVDEEIISEIFLTGTAPKVRDNFSNFIVKRRQEITENIRTSLISVDLRIPSLNKSDTDQINVPSLFDEDLSTTNSDFVPQPLFNFMDKRIPDRTLPSPIPSLTEIDQHLNQIEQKPIETLQFNPLLD